MLPPELTTEQKQKFEKGFSEIMADAPEEVQALWDGKVHWYPSLQPPISYEIISGLKGELFNRFEALFMAMYNRTI
jgi:hypothetical protein